MCVERSKAMPEAERSSFSADVSGASMPWAVVLLGVCLFLAIAYFHGGGLWNQNSRFNAIFSFVEPGYPDHLTFRINRFLKDPAAGYNTGDWAQDHGHYYSNKAPGTILLGAAVYGVLYGVEGVLGLDPSRAWVQLLNLYLINLVVSGLVVTVGICCLARLFRERGLSVRFSLLLAGGLGFGTMLFPYSTQFWGHTTAAGFVMMGLYCLEKPGRVCGLLCGFFVGLAVMCDYLCGVVVVTVAGVLLWRTPRRCPWFVFGGLVPLASFMLYHIVCFGSPFVIANQFENPIFREGGYLFGFGGWRFVRNFVSLLLTRYRGLPIQMPLLFLSLVGSAVWFRCRPREPLLWLCVANVLLLLLANALFNGWHGGATVCARYQIVALPFWGILLQATPRRRIWRTVFALLLAVSCLNMLAVASVSPVSPPAEPGSPAIFFNPLYGWTYSRFFAGELAPYKAPLLLHGGSFWNAFNAGHLLGLRGLASLIPLLVLETAGLFGVWRLTGVAGEQVEPCDDAVSGQEEEAPRQSSKNAR